MKIMVIGDTASGKTTFCKEFAKTFPEYVYINMDTLIQGRSNKVLAEIEMVVALFQNKHVILEMVGPDDDRTAAVHRFFEPLVVRIDASAAVRFQRLQERAIKGEPFAKLCVTKIYPHANLVYSSELMSAKNMVDKIKEII